MKSLFANVLLASLMVFTVACGKDSKKKSRGYNWYNPYMGSGAVVQGQAAVQNLNAYLNATENKALPGGLSAVPVQYKVQEGTGCSQKEILGIPFTYCSYNGFDVEYENTIINIPANQQRKLYSGLAPVANTLTMVGVMQQGQYIDVFHIVPGTQKIVRYTIDTNLHAGLNPRRIEDGSTQTVTELVNYGLGAF